MAVTLAMAAADPAETSSISIAVNDLYPPVLRNSAGPHPATVAAVRATAKQLQRLLIPLRGSVIEALSGLTELGSLVLVNDTRSDG